jgi:ABC-type bacteriocin/lantibiotic exporter with double-glycine peptidase domain
MIAHGESELNEDLKQQVIEHSKIYVSEQEAPIRLSDDVSYVQQQPWIQNKSIKNNILFGMPYDEEKYKETIKICELKRDLQILPAGDETEIGEKGINLSGG